MESSSPSPHVQRKRADKRRTILDAAMAVVVDDGLDGLTMARLGEAVGQRPGALYRYFPGKDALLVALQRRAIDALGQRLEAVMDAAPSPLAALVAGARLYAALPSEAPAQARLVDDVLSAPGHLLPDAAAAEVFASAMPVVRDLAGRLEAMAEAGLLAPGDAVVRTFMLWSALHGLGNFRKLTRMHPGVEPAAMLNPLLHTLLVGWGADPARVEEALR